MKLRSPSFWQAAHPNFLSNLLLPLCWITRYLGRKRQKATSYKLPVPVLCCGNISTGGTGKTPLVCALVKELRAQGRSPHIITRGYGGKELHSKRLTPATDTALNVGDEAMLLAQYAPTWRGPDRLANARRAIDHGADCLILDDGLQNPTLYKDVSILTIDGPIGFGNNRLLPAGPLRESLEDVLPRIQTAVIVGDDTHHLHNQLSHKLPVTQLFFVPGDEILSLQKHTVIAFAGIGRPEKFFKMLQDHHIHLAQQISFPDHHIYSTRDIKRLKKLAKMANAILVTTEKDSIKLPESFRQEVTTISVELRGHHTYDLEKLLEPFLSISREGASC